MNIDMKSYSIDLKSYSIDLKLVTDRITKQLVIMEACIFEPPASYTTLRDLLMVEIIQ